MSEKLLSPEDLVQNSSSTTPVEDEEWKRIELLGLSPESQRKVIGSKSTSDESDIEKCHKEDMNSSLAGQETDDPVDHSDKTEEEPGSKEITSKEADAEQLIKQNADREYLSEENEELEDEQTDSDIDDNSNGDNGSDNCQESDAESHVQEDEEIDDNKTPTHVPRRTGFWGHDDRFADIHVEESRQPRRNQTLWDKSEVKRWEHDRYVEAEQGPKEEWEKMGPSRRPRDRHSGRGGRRNQTNFSEYIPDSYNKNYNNDSNRRGDHNRGTGRGYDRNTEPRSDDLSEQFDDFEITNNDRNRRGDRNRGRGRVYDRNTEPRSDDLTEQFDDFEITNNDRNRRGGRNRGRGRGYDRNTEPRSDDLTEQFDDFEITNNDHNRRGGRNRGRGRGYDRNTEPRSDDLTEQFDDFEITNNDRNRRGGRNRGRGRGYDRNTEPRSDDLTEQFDDFEITNNDRNRRGGRNRGRGRGYDRNTEPRSDDLTERFDDFEIADIDRGRNERRGGSRRPQKQIRHQRGNYNERERYQAEEQDDRNRDAGNDRPSRYQNYRKNDQRKFSNSEAKTNEPLSPQYDREEYQQDDRNYEHHRVDRKEEDLPGVEDGAPRDKPKRYSSQRQKTGTGQIDDIGKTDIDAQPYYQQIEYLQQQFMTNAHLTAIQNQQAHDQDILSKTANIKMLEQKILSLQQELQRQYNTPTPQQQPISNLVNPQTNIPIQVPGMMPHIADINQRAPVYGDPLYGISQGALQNMLGDGTVHPSSHINPAVLSQLMSTVAVQEQLGSQLYVPPPPPQQLETQPPMQRNESEQHESRRNRPAAIPIKPPPGL